MAKTRAPLFSLAASGTVAKGLTYSTWKGRRVVRQHAGPTNPRTIPQQRSRSSFLHANAIWDAMLALAKAPWDAYAVSKVQSGLNAFVGHFMTDNYGQPDLLGMTFSAGTKGAPRPTDVQITAGSLQITVDFVAPDPPQGWVLASAVAATIRDGDPETLQFHRITIDDFQPGAGQVILTDLEPGTIYVVAGWLTWTTPDGAVAYSPSSPAQTANPLAKFNAVAVRFDGTTTWLDRGAGLTGAAVGPLALISMWFNLHGGDGIAQSFIHAAAARLRVIRLASDNLQIQFKRPDNTVIYRFTSIPLFSTSENPGWHHLLIAADLNVSPLVQVYLDDAVPPGTTSIGPFEDDIDWLAADWGIGGTPAGANRAAVDMSEVYFTPEYLDISVEAERRKFINWLGQPVDLGFGGATPTGTLAIGFFDGLTIAWHTNKGTGGGFTENGALTEAPTSPSD